LHKSVRFLVERRKLNDINMISLPNLFIVGAPKAGTTSLVMNLESTGEVFVPNIKEPNYFISKKFSNAVSVSLYKDYIRLYKTKKKYKYYCDASTSYLYDVEACEKIYRFNPASKIIVMLRDPVERAISHYKMEKFLYMRESLDLENAIREENKHDYFGYNVNPYIAPSRYCTQVKKYLDRFGGENVKVVILENTSNLSNDISVFLGTNEFENRRYNEGRVVRNSMIAGLLTMNFGADKLRKYLPNSVKQFVQKKVFSDSSKIDLKVSASFKKEIYHKYFEQDIMCLGKLIDMPLEKWTY